MQLSQPLCLTPKLCDNNGPSICSTFCSHPLLSKSWVTASANTFFFGRKTIKALRRLKEISEKMMNCVVTGSWWSLLLLPGYKMQMDNQVWWLTKEGQRRRGKHGGSHLITQIKIFRWFYGSEIVRLRAAVKATSDAQTRCRACLLCLLVCSIITCSCR